MILDKRLMAIAKAQNEHAEFPNICYVRYDFERDQYYAEEIIGTYPIVLYFDSGETGYQSLSKFVLACIKDESLYYQCKDYFERHYDTFNVSIVRHWNDAVRLANENTLAMRYHRNEVKTEINWSRQA